MASKLSPRSPLRLARTSPASARKLVRALVKDLDEWAPPGWVRSEKLLDRAFRDHVRQWLRERIAIPTAELRRWVAGHERLKAYKANWTGSKAYQVVTLWGAGKTSDLFIYHPEGRHGLPRRGISFEVKYVGRSRRTRKAQSYAGAIATTAGQLLAYSTRHYWTVGFIWINGERRKRTARTQLDQERCQDLLRRLPRNASLLVRFRGSSGTP
jgi:hypothetical protein